MKAKRGRPKKKKRHSVYHDLPSVKNLAKKKIISPWDAKTQTRFFKSSIKPWRKPK